MKTSCDKISSSEVREDDKLDIDAGSEDLKTGTLLQADGEAAEEENDH